MEATSFLLHKEEHFIKNTRKNKKDMHTIQSHRLKLMNLVFIFDENIR